MSGLPYLACCQWDPALDKHHKRDGWVKYQRRAKEKMPFSFPKLNMSKNPNTFSLLLHNKEKWRRWLLFIVKMVAILCCCCSINRISVIVWALMIDLNSGFFFFLCLWSNLLNCLNCLLEVWPTLGALVCKNGCIMTCCDSEGHFLSNDLLMIENLTGIKGSDLTKSRD